MNQLWHQRGRERLASALRSDGFLSRAPHRGVTADRPEVMERPDQTFLGGGGFSSKSISQPSRCEARRKTPLTLKALDKSLPPPHLSFLLTPEDRSGKFVPASLSQHCGRLGRVFNITLPGRRGMVDNLKKDTRQCRANQSLLNKTKVFRSRSTRNGPHPLTAPLPHDDLVHRFGTLSQGLRLRRGALTTCFMFDP